MQKIAAPNGILFVFTLLSFLLAFAPSANAVLRGDLNLNGIPFELDDAVIYSDFFRIGLPAFIIMPDSQIAASDINEDGYFLTVADYVMLVRVYLTGDDPPTDPTDTINGNFVLYEANQSYVIGASFDATPGKLWMIFETVYGYDITVLPTAAGAAANLDYSYSGYTLMIDISGLENVTFNPTGETPLLRVNYEQEPTFERMVGLGANGEAVAFQSDTSAIPGDINLNSVPYEIADMVLFQNAMFIGTEAFTIDVDLQLEATDVNRDGIPLTVEDYQYFLAVRGGYINDGDPAGPNINANFIRIECPGFLSVRAQYGHSPGYSDGGAILFKYYAPNIGNYSVSTPTLPPEQSIGYNIVNDTLKLLLSDLSGAPIVGNYKEIFDIVYDGDAPTFVSAQASGHLGGSATGGSYLLGDANMDGSVNLGDVVYQIYCLPICDFFDLWLIDLNDPNQDGSYNIGDPVFLINHIFRGGPRPGC